MNKKLQFIIPLVLLICGLFSMPVSIFETGLTKMPGDLGDCRFNNYVLEHGHKYITGKVDSFWDAPFLFPYKNVTALSDNLLGSLPVYSVFRLVMDRENAFLCWLFAMFTLNFICCFIALKKWSGEVLLSSAGAYIFAFSIYNLGQLDHVQIMPKFMAPLIIYWFWKFLSEKQVRYFTYASLGLVFQFYCGIYLAFFVIYVLLFLSVSYFIVYRNFEILNILKSKKDLVTILSTVVISLAVLYPVIEPYLEVAEDMGMRKFESALSTIPRLSSYFFSTGSSAVWNILSHHAVGDFPDYWNHHLFIGAIPWISVGVALFIILKRNDDVIIRKNLSFILLTLFLCFIFCLNVDGHTLYKIIFKFPGFSSMRSIDRIINIEVFLFIVTFVFSVKAIVQKYPRTKFLLYVLPILVVLENQVNASEVKRFDKYQARQRIKDVKRNIQKQYDPSYAAIAYMPFQTYLEPDHNSYLGSVENALDAMIACQDLNIKCVNSYTGFDPGNYLNFFNEPTDRTLREWCEFSKADYNSIQRVNDIGKMEISRRKIHLQTFNGKFVCAIEDADPVLEGNRDAASSWETFTIVRLKNNECMIKARTNLLFHVESDGSIKASGKTGDVSETFIITDQPDSTSSFLSGNGKYLTVDTVDFRIKATATEAGTMERFRIVEL